MKRILVSIIILLSMSSVYAQKKSFSAPDFKKVSKAISKQSSSAYYPMLMERLKANDTTLTPREYHLLYYGYALQPGYSPERMYSAQDSLLALMNREVLVKSDYNRIIELASSALNEYPFEISILDPLIYALRMEGKHDLAAKLEFRFGRIIETIFNSGDGLTKETAFYVVSVAHQKDMLRALGFGFGGQQMMAESNISYLKVAKNDFGIDGMYFNVSAIYRNPLK
jgi:hypothetical protein